MTDDELLASAMRKLLTDPAAYVDLWDHGDGTAFLQIDGDTQVTSEEIAACKQAQKEGRP